MLALAAGGPARAEGAETPDGYLDILRGVFAPAGTELFESVRRELATSARPLPERVRPRPFFDGTRRDGVALDPDVLARLRYRRRARGAGRAQPR